MMKKYDITADFPGGDTYTLRIDNEFLPLKRGWRILDLGTHQVLGVIIHEWRTVTDYISIGLTRGWTDEHLRFTSDNRRRRNWLCARGSNND